MEEEKKDEVVVMIGEKERKEIKEKGKRIKKRQKEWNEEYKKRVEELKKVIRERNYKIVWVGKKNLRKKGMQKDMMEINEIYRNEEEKEGGKFEDVWDGLVDEEGNFKKKGLDIKGKKERMRENEGIKIK